MSVIEKIKRDLITTTKFKNIHYKKFQNVFLYKTKVPNIILFKLVLSKFIEPTLHLEEVFNYIIYTSQEPNYVLLLILYYLTCLYVESYEINHNTIIICSILARKYTCEHSEKFSSYIQFLQTSREHSGRFKSIDHLNRLEKNLLKILDYRTDPGYTFLQQLFFTIYED